VPSRRAIVVADSAGPPEVVADSLSRFGFATIIPAARIEQALARLRGESFDLLIVPIQHVDPNQLSALEREIRAQPGLSVVGTAPTADPDHILRAMRAGIHEFLVYPPTPHELAAAVERLLNRGGNVAQSGQVLAIHSGKGGLGTTSVAVNLAQALAVHETKARVALADCVFTGGDVRVFLNLQPSYDIGDLVAKLSEVDGALLRSLMTAGPGGMSVLPASEDPIFVNEFDGATVGAVIEQLRGNFDITVVDCEHHLSQRTLAILDAADRIVLVTQPNVPSLRSTQRTLSLFRRLGYADSKSCVVVNRFQPGDVFSQSTIAESLKHEIFWSLPNDYRTSVSSLNKGVSVTQQDAGSKLARSYAQLAAKLRTTQAGSANGATDPQQRSGIRGLFGKSGRIGHVA
jgi:pilus assembly protein CpaE